MKIHPLTLNPSVDRLLVVPGFARGGHFRAQRVMLFPAGKGVNVARYLRIMGEEPTAWALVGKRELPLYRDDLYRSGIRARLYPVRGNTRQNITIIDPKRGETHIREPGFQVAEREWELLLRDLALTSSEGDAVSLSGSFPGGLGGKHLISMFRNLPHRFIFLDINEVDLQLDRVPRDTHITLKVNASEFQQLSGGKPSAGNVREFLSAFPSLERVVVTNGRKDVLWLDGNVSLSARPPKAKVKSAVGAGDAFLAGMLAGFARGLEPPECIRLAVAAGSASTLETFVGEMDLKQVQALAAKVKVKALRR